MGVHREAEFTRNHAPAYARGKAPEAWVCVYPFVRSYDWYYMNPERRAEMLKNHGMKAIDFPQILANTVATFGMNDYEWVLALEAPELVDLVDMMRHFRNTEARLHVREETPFYTGRRIGADEVAEVSPRALSATPAHPPTARSCRTTRYPTAPTRRTPPPTAPPRSTSRPSATTEANVASPVNVPKMHAPTTW